ncbi:MAG: RNA 2',3'-cyclic phosphodiesterase [Acidobacteria bacterium]|nr:MAG: RNA 2',3'-cyclic phosphodiesterase [Acidobacteriota bacterium]
MRLFVAVDLSEGARRRIAGLQQRIAAAPGGPPMSLKWVTAEHAHLTLVFLGRVDDTLVPSVVDAFGRDVDRPPFDMVLDGLGVFPPRGAPRVLWAGVAAGAPELGDLQRLMAERVIALGIELEDRPFHPHLTLGRWRRSRPPDRDRALAAVPSGAIARVGVTCATLYESRLSSSGPTYVAHARATLARS